MNGNIRRPSVAATSVSSSISGKESVGDVLRKAKKELIFKRICLALFLVVLAALIVYLFVAGYVSNLIDDSLALIE